MKISKYNKNNKTAYMFQGYLGTDKATGKRVRVTRQGFNSPKECELEFYRLKLQFEEGDLVKKEKYTFSEVYELWIEQYKNTVKESTLQKTLTLFELHILPFYGHMYLNMIKVNHCQEAINKWFCILKNYRTMNNYTSLVFKHGMKLGLITTDPTKLVTIPNRKEKYDEEKIENYYTREELISFLNIVRKNNSLKWYTLFRLLAFTGCRKGEILSLTWDDISFSENTINISKTLTMGLGNSLIVQTPKTKKSKRLIPIDDATMQILREWKKEQSIEQLMLGYNTIKKTQLVFTNSKNTYINPQKIGQKLVYFANQENHKVITPHGFRHTHCSLLFEAGASIKEVQERLGHSDIQTTMNIYAHVTQKKQEETAQKFAKYINI